MRLPLSEMILTYSLLNTEHFSRIKMCFHKQLHLVFVQSVKWMRKEQFNNDNTYHYLSISSVFLFKKCLKTKRNIIPSQEQNAIKSWEIIRFLFICYSKIQNEGDTHSQFCSFCNFGLQFYGPKTQRCSCKSFLIPRLILIIFICIKFLKSKLCFHIVS